MSPRSAVPGEARSVTGVDEDLRSLQHKVLEVVATGRPLPEVMDVLCRGAEKLAPDVVCSVLVVDGRDHLHHLAAPSLPDHYSRAIDGMKIGPSAGSCGTAAFRGEAVEVLDIETDPLWADFRHLALPLGFRACWSSPIKSSLGRVIGTFAFYYRTPRSPSEVERRIVDGCLNHCAIAIEHEQARAQISRLAYNDTLTGLANRASFQLEAEQALGRVASAGNALAIHFIDIDDFKGVNDTLGHRVGDRMLQLVAERLTACATDGEIVARLGGDEFAIIQSLVRSDSQIRTFADRLMAAFEDTFSIEGHRIRVSASVGIARAPEDGDDLTTLLRKADLALYHAKAAGRSVYRSFAQEMEAALHKRRALEQDLHNAVRSKAFTLHYQPVVDMSSGDIVSFEALVRWRHPLRGIIGPVDFIGIAEDTGLIEEIGDWVLNEACMEAARWPADISVAVNLSSRQFSKDNFTFDIVKTLERTGLPAHRLILEITESILIADSERVGRSLQHLRTLGTQIALDDFGTGYSSLSYLRSFPFTKIKIDKSFVDDVSTKRDSTAIVRAVIALAHDLGMKTTAEGVESGRQLELLRQEGCDEAQGFYLGRPIEASLIPDLIDRFRQLGPEQRIAISG